MIIKRTGVIICALVIQSSVASVWAMDDEENRRSWFLGAGIGVSELDPDTNVETTGYYVTQSRDTGFKLFGGYDFTERFTVEAFYADLGSAQVGSDFITLPDGTIDYSTLGVSALWYFWRNGKSTGKDIRRGLQAYVQGGLSFLDNSSSVNYTQDNSTQIQYGAGLEFGLNNGVALRAGFDLYDKDAGMIVFSVLKRFGTKSKRKVVSEPAPEPVQEPVVESVVEPVQPQAIIAPVVVIQDIDTDKDGVVDRLDECADSPADFSVDEKGCTVIDLDLGGVNFEPQSFELTEESKRLLDEAVISISVSPELQVIEVQAHTDNKGSEKYNLKLSEQRAASVKQYLISQGIHENRLVSKGYGESLPVADNKTEEGRAQNRRVELKVVGDEVENADTQSPEVETPEVEAPEVGAPVAE